MITDTSLALYTETAQRAANQVISAYSTSFKLATCLLGARHRQHVRNIYALVRVADELVDGLTAEAGLTVAQQNQALEHYITETHLAMSVGYSSDLVIHAFARTAQAVGIDETLTSSFFASMRTDLRQDDTAGASTQHFDAAAHAAYVYGSAEVVGLMCLRVFSHGHNLDQDAVRITHDSARQLGAAFQNINFLRDLADDSDRLGRNYLGDGQPLTDSDRVAWVRRIRQELADAERGIPYLPRDARAAVRSARALFTALTNRIEATSIDDIYQRRVRVPDPVKILLALRSVLVTWLEPRS